MPDLTSPRVAPAWWRRLSPRRGAHATGSGSAVSGTVEEYVRVIPVLAGQVRETASQIEHSAFEITSRFMSVVERARQAASSAWESKRTAAASGSADEVARVRRTLRRLLGHNVRNAQMSLDAVARMAEAVRAMATIGTAATEVDRITVVELEKSLALAIDTLRQFAAADTPSLIEDTDEAERVLGRLDAGSAAMQRELEASAAASERIADDVARAVVAMQFHDRVNQRLQDVVETLTEMHQDFSGALAGSDPDDAAGGTAITRLRLRYTMAAERMVERAAPASGGEVELC